MRKRCVAAGVALIVSMGPLIALPSAAQAAAGGSILYVDNGSAGGGNPCSDKTTDSSTTPYCTIQAAADVVVPGQTVEISPGEYDGDVTISRSGTASAPIVFEGTGDSRSGTAMSTVRLGNQVNARTAGYALELNGVSNVEISNVAVFGETAGAVYVTGSSDVTVDRSYVQPFGTPGVEVAGGSTAVTVKDDYLETGPSAVRVDAGDRGTTIANDYAENAQDAVAVDGAADTAVSGNTFVLASGAGVAVTGDATGTSIENDIIEPSDNGVGISADTGSAPGTTADYNIVYGSATTAYSWAGTAYATPAAFTTGTGQGAHDLASNPKVLGTNPPIAGSPAINSGDASAPGEQDTDYAGNPRVLEPGVPVTGTGGGYYDRGAVEVVDPLTVSLSASNTWAAGSATEKFTAKTTVGWSASVTYDYDFGDGLTQSSSSPVIEHTYTTVGEYKAVVTVVDADHGSATSSAEIHVVGGNAYYPLTPARVLDTRSGIGTAAARVPAGGSVSVKLAGVGGIPATGAVAAVLNVTAVGPSANGVITVYPDGAALPTASNLNFLRGENRPNLVTVEIGADGSVRLRNTGSGTVDLVADLAGYYAPGTGAGWMALQSYRVGEFKLTVGKPVELDIDNSSTGPTALDGATAVVANITATGGTANGYISAYAAGGTVPATSNVNYGANEDIANLAIAPLSSDGGIELVAGGKAGATVTAIVDLLGFYATGDYWADGFVPVQPIRLVDTRTGLGVPHAGPTSSTEVLPGTLKGMPAGSVGMAANITVVAPSGNGYLSAYEWNEVTATSTLNFRQGQNVANMAEYGWNPAFSDQYLYLDTSGPTAGLVIDMFGYFVG